MSESQKALQKFSKIAQSRAAAGGRGMEEKGWMGFCDGSYFQKKAAMGVGGVLVSPNGDLHAEISKATRVTGPLDPRGSARAEFWAAKELLLAAKEKKVSHLTLHMDNRGVVGALRFGNSRNEEMRAWAQWVLEELPYFQQVVFRWIPRFKNAVADSLAKQAVGGTEEGSGEPTATSRRGIKPNQKWSEPLAERLKGKHPGLEKIARPVIGGGVGDKRKEDARWRGALMIKTHAVHVEHGNQEMATAGAEWVGADGADRAFALTEKKASPLLAEVRLIAAMLEKAKGRGIQRLRIETTNQMLSGMCLGGREAPAHLMPALTNLWKNAEGFEEISIRHRAEAPLWAKEIEGWVGGATAKELRNGFQNAIPTTTIKSHAFEANGSSWVALELSVAGGEGVTQLKEWSAAKSHLSLGAWEAICVGKLMKKLSDLGVRRVDLKSLGACMELPAHARDSQAKREWEHAERMLERGAVRVLPLGLDAIDMLISKATEHARLGRGTPRTVGGHKHQLR